MNDTYNKASQLPSPAGRTVSVPLALLPAYFSIHRIQPDGRYPFPLPGSSEQVQILIVKPKETTNE
jgi:hypothetical protein